MPTGPFVSMAKADATKCRISHLSRLSSSLMASHRQKTEALMQSARQMSVSMSRDITVNSTPEASTTAAQKPARGEKARRPNHHVSSTSSVAAAAEGARAAKLPPPKIFHASMDCQ